MSPSCPSLKPLSQLHAQSTPWLLSLHAAVSTFLAAATKPALHAGASVGDVMYPTPSARGTLTPRHRYSNPGDQGPEGAAYQEEGLDPVQEVPAARGYHADAQQGPYPQGDGALPMCTLPSFYNMTACIDAQRCIHVRHQV